ncbi:MAG: HAMP domain-containing histidine kinase, partial [Methanomicrobia archaeon]|nr:HAMP domain-containing histidine kinase [Methanomicrobia archaeon]
VPDELKEAIFERFERGDVDVKGSGLGLAIVKKIVDLHGGKAWVENNPEGGSIFFVEIPKMAK